MIERIGELADAGVTSFKIEGRMKRPEYVAAATAACRFALDQQVIPQSLTENPGSSIFPFRIYNRISRRNIRP